MSIALGIDLGTTNSCAAVATPVGADFALGGNGERVHPSIVAYPESGDVVVGHDARPLRVTEPTSTIYSAKRLIGQNVRSPLVQLALHSLHYKVEEGPNQQPIIVVRDRHLTVPEVSAQVLGHLKRLAERQFDDAIAGAVITVPANFSDAQRRATQEAGRIAGLDVVRLVNEPTAAALAYGFGQRKNEIVVVYDFGGGTFDVSILQIRGEIFEVLATDGDFFLGGDDIDRTVTEFLAAEMNRSNRIDPSGNHALMARLSVAAEEIKRHLSEHDVAAGTIDGLDAGNGRMFSLPFRLSRQQLEQLIVGYVDRTIELCRGALTAAGIAPGKVSEVLCVGGSTRIPMVRQRLADAFGKLPQIRINPDEVVAQGAAIQAGSLTGALGEPEPRKKTPTGSPTLIGVPAAPMLGAAAAVAARARSTDFTPPIPTKPAMGPMPLPIETSGVSTIPPPIGEDPLSFSQVAAVPRPLLLDVTPATMGLATAGGYCEKLIEKNAPIPIERTKLFTTARDEQTKVVIDCCRGEARRYADNEPLGNLVLDGLPARLRGDVKIEVTFRVDTDGILQVRARDVGTGAAQEVTLTILGAPQRGT